MTTAKMPPVTCAPWCTQGDGHPEQVFAEDQNCYGPADYTHLAAEPDTQVGVLAFKSNGQPPTLRLHLMAEEGGIDVDPELTADEAREIAARLLAAADLIEGTG